MGSSKLDEAGYRAELLMLREPKYPIDLAYIQSLYYPPNGLWVYKLTASDD